MEKFDHESRISFDIETEDSGNLLKDMLEETQQIERIDILVLRMHIYIEEVLHHLIEKRVDAFDQELVENNFKYFNQKESLVKELYELEDDLKHNISIISNMRNTVAHDIKRNDIKDSLEEQSEQLRSLGVFGSNDHLPELNTREEILVRGFQTFFSLKDYNRDVFQELSYKKLVLSADHI